VAEKFDKEYSYNNDLFFNKLVDSLLDHLSYYRAGDPHIVEAAEYAVEIHKNKKPVEGRSDRERG